MAILGAESQPAQTVAGNSGHAIWVRICHWATTLSFIALAVSGFLILMVHPRLYWGEVGNDLTQPILELPISDNHRPDGWEQTVTFADANDAPAGNAPFSANRTYQIFNQNRWARSLHFLAAWLLVVAGAIYLIAAVVTGHFWRDIFPRLRDLDPKVLWTDFKQHLRFKFSSGGAGQPYGSLQRLAYLGVVLVALPLMVLTGLAMSPAVQAGYPILLDLFGGHQSARTIHFFGFAALILFFVVHVTMVILTGFRRQLRAMIMGN